MKAEELEKPLNNNEYRCDGCGNVYKFGWSEEEAKAECKKNFGTDDISNMAVLCDDCYNQLVPMIFN